MTTNNAINIGPLATNAEALAATDDRKPLTPATLKHYLDNAVITDDQFLNLGVEIASGELRIKSADLTNLSATNRAILRIASNVNPGQLIQYTVEANSVLDQSDLDDNLFGTELGVAWGETKPFYLYALTKNDDTELVFAISAIPHRAVSPDAARLSKPGLTTASTQGSMFLMNNVTLADYEGTVCQLLGSFRMTKNGADEWAIASIGRFDGINMFQDNQQFIMPSGQQGATLYLRPNGGTPPTFTTNIFRYYVETGGSCQMIIDFNGDGGVDGSGAVNLQLVTPYKHEGVKNIFGAAEMVFGATIGGMSIEHDKGYAEFWRSNGQIKLQYSVFNDPIRNINSFSTFEIGLD
jgi:hypothetical protein